MRNRNKIQMSSKKLIIFDFDGTIVDSMDTFADVAAKVINEIYGTSISKAREAYIKTSGLPFYQQLELIFPGDPRNDQAAKTFEKDKLLGYFEKRIYSDVYPALQKLEEAEIKSAVSSNNYQELVEEFVNKRNIKFDYVLGFKNKNFCKGKPHFKHLIKKTELDKESLLFVGDSLKDAERAGSFEIDFVGKTGLFSKKDFLDNYPDIIIVDKLTELFDMEQK